MPRITGSSHLSPNASQGNEMQRPGNQGASNARSRSLLGSLAAVFGCLGRPPTRETGETSTTNRSPSAPRRSAPNAASPRETPPHLTPPRETPPRASLARQRALRTGTSEESERYPAQGGPQRERLGRRLAPSRGATDRASTSHAATARPMLSKGLATTGSSSTANAVRLAARMPKVKKGHVRFESLEPHVQEALLDRLDPSRQLGLKDDAVLYRMMDKSFLTQDEHGRFTVEGNPNSEADVTNYLELKPSALVDDQAFLSTLPRETRESFQNDPSMRYEATRCPASELPHPTLNVMYGKRAREVAQGYPGKDRVLVKIKLGDLLEAGGGQTFRDVKAAARGRDCQPLIVTLPAGKSVPVEIA